MSIKAMCIDDTNKPKEIPENYWVKKGSLYTIIDIRQILRQNHILGVELDEIDLMKLENCEYKYFRLSRFAINIDDLPKLKELIEQSRELAELDGIDILKLIEEQSEIIETV